MPLPPRPRLRLRLRQRPVSKGFALLAEISAAPGLASAATLALGGIRATLSIPAAALVLCDRTNKPQIILDTAHGYDRRSSTQLGVALLDAMQQHPRTLEYPRFLSAHLELQHEAEIASSVPGAVLATPLLIGDQLLGVLSVEADRLHRWTRREVALAEAIAAQLAQAFHSERRIAQLQYSEKLSSACQTLTALTAGMDVAGTSRAIVEQAALATGAAGAQLFLRRRNRGELEPVAVHGVVLVTEGRHARIDCDPAGGRALSHRPEWLFGNEPEPAPMGQGEPCNPDEAQLAVSLLDGNELVGVITLSFTAAAARPCDAMLPAIERFATHAAAALRNAHQYDSAAQRARRMVELARATQVLDAQANIAASIEPLAQQSLHILDAQGCIVALHREGHEDAIYAVGLSDTQRGTICDNEAFQSLLCGTPLSQDIPQRQPAIRQPEAQLDQAARDAGFAAQLTLPLTHKDAMVGVITYLYGADHTWNDDDFETAGLIASQMTTLIANAQLYHEVHEANRLKSEFIATISHELRTPMGAIMGYAELLASGSYGAIPDMMHEPLGRLKANADTLLLLINQMLDLSRIEAGRLELHSEPFHPADLLRAVASAAQPQLRGKRITFETVVEDTVPGIVLGDVGRLRQMLGNLVDNGLKFTQYGGLLVRCSRVDEPNGAKLVFDVSDSGPGIPEDKLRVIWQPFRQGNSSETRSHSGAGLGLTIVHKLTELMGGTTAVVSRLGIGSTFSIRLPLHLPPS